MAVHRTLTGPASRNQLARITASVRDSDPYGLDLQLALFMCYELHYRGFAGVDATWEWNPALLHLRAELEHAFLAGVRRDVGLIEPGDTAAIEMETISVEPVDGTGPSYYLRDTGSWQQRVVLRAQIALPPQGRRPARLGDSAPDGYCQGGLRCDRVRRIRRRAGPAPAPAALRRSIDRG